MKKLLKIFLVLLMLSGCSKDKEMPKLHAKDLEYDYKEEVDLDLDNLLDLNEFTDKEIKELNKNADIDLSELEYDDDENIMPGKYDITISYYEDVVTTKLTINEIDDNDPVFEKIEGNIVINLGDSLFDFSTIIKATSPLNLELSYEFDTSKIDFDTPGEYTLVVTAKDTEGNKKKKSFTVEVVASETEDTNVEESSNITNSNTTTQTPSSYQTTTTTPSSNYTPSYTAPVVQPDNSSTITENDSDTTITENDSYTTITEPIVEPDPTSNVEESEEQPSTDTEVDVSGAEE